MRIREIILIILYGLLFSSSAENEINHELSSSELKEDASVLRKALEKYHPGIYWYTSKEEFNQSWDSLDAKLNVPMPDDQFFKLLLPVVAKAKCTHTLFYPSDKIISSGLRFPLNLKFIGGKAYIMSDASNQNFIPGGSELLSINGRPVKEILISLFPYLEAQGGNMGWKYVILENDFQNYYYYVMEHAESFVIEYADANTKQKQTVTVNGSADKLLRNHWKNWYPEEDGAPLSLIFKTDPDVAMITIKSLTGGRYKMHGQDFEKLIDRYFSEIRLKRMQNLIIDIRGNEGGSESVEHLYSYMKIKEANTTDRKNSYDKIKPANHVYHGNVILLANERSISNLERFVSIFRYYKRGLIIGQNTPGSMEGLCGGNKHITVLPNSHFEIRIPLHKIVYEHLENDAHHEGEGFPPDIRVEENINDILENKDPAMQLAIDKIKEGL